MGNQTPQQKIKGNPAHKRIVNAKRKASRERSWTRGQARKNARRLAQSAREKANNERRANGIPTPWEAAKADRYERRH